MNKTRNLKNKLYKYTYLIESKTLENNIKMLEQEIKIISLLNLLNINKTNLDIMKTADEEYLSILEQEKDIDNFFYFLDIVKEEDINQWLEDSDFKNLDFINFIDNISSKIEELDTKKNKKVFILDKNIEILSLSEKVSLRKQRGNLETEVVFSRPSENSFVYAEGINKNIANNNIIAINIDTIDEDLIFFIIGLTEPFKHDIIVYSDSTIDEDVFDFVEHIEIEEFIEIEELLENF